MSSLESCKNCSLKIHIDFKECPFCKIDNPFIPQTCSICLNPINYEPVKLNCDHYLHNNCYIGFLASSNRNTCPICNKIFTPIKILCGACNKPLNLDEAKCDTFRSLDCKCFFHYDCIKRSKTIHCINCIRNVDPNNFDALSYLFFMNGYNRWIGRFPKCKMEGCNLTSNPKRYGYCFQHGQDKIASNKVISLAFNYFTKFIFEQNEKKRQHIFELLLEFFDKNLSVEKIDWSQIKNEFNDFSSNILEI